MNGTKGRFLYGLRSWQGTKKKARTKRAKHVCGLLEGNTWNKKNKGWNKTKRGWNSGAGWTKRQALKEKRGAELNVSWTEEGLKHVLGWKSILGWKIKGNTPKEKKKKAGRKEKTKRGGWPGKRKEKEVCSAERKRKRGLEQRKRAEQIIFQHLFSFESSQKNDGEFVYVEFDF